MRVPIITFFIMVCGVHAKPFEGDIKVFKHQVERSYGVEYASKMLRGGFIEGDNRKTPLVPLGADPFITWTDGVVPYTFKEGDFSLKEQAKIEEQVKKMHDKLKPFVTFRRYNEKTDPNYVVFETGQGGCWSYLGMIGGPQTVNLGGEWCFDLVFVEHELMHALGFWHEQSRADRDEYVKVHLENVQEGLEDQFDKRDRLDDYGFKYDYKSIMHYGAKSFSKNGKPVLEAINPPGSPMGNWDSMSESDIGQTRALYGELALPSPEPTKYPDF